MNPVAEEHFVYNQRYSYSNGGFAVDFALCGSQPATWQRQRNFANLMNMRISQDGRMNANTRRKVPSMRSLAHFLRNLVERTFSNTFLDL